MLLLGLAIALGAMVGWASRRRHVGGSGHLTIPRRAIGLLAVAAGLQVLLRLLPADGRATVGSWLVVASALAAAAALVLLGIEEPRLRAAVTVALLGAGLNAVVMLSNGGMPVSADAAEKVGLDLPVGRDDTSARHVVLDDDTRLSVLADVIPINLGPSHVVVSVGDLLLLAAAAVATYAVTRVATVTVSRRTMAPRDALQMVAADLRR